MDKLGIFCGFLLIVCVVIITFRRWYQLSLTTLASIHLPRAFGELGGTFSGHIPIIIIGNHPPGELWAPSKWEGKSLLIRLYPKRIRTIFRNATFRDERTGIIHASMYISLGNIVESYNAQL